MDIIVTDLIEVLKREQTIIGRERAMMAFFCSLFITITQLVFEELDKELSKTYKDQGFKVERRIQRTVTFLFGSVQFKRRRMKDAKGNVVHPLDDFLGIKRRTRFSTLVLRNVAELSSLMVYRHVSKAVELLTPVSISHQKAQSLTILTGQILEEAQVREDRFDAYQPKKQVPILYIEGDGVQLKGTGKKKLEIHRYQVYEDRKQIGKRGQLIGMHYVSSLDRRQALKEMTAYLEHTYELSETIIVSTSDGGSGYEKAVFDELALGSLRHEHFRDPYHVNRKIKERLNFCPELHDAFFKAIYSHHWDNLTPCFDTAESLIDEPHEKEKLEQLELLKKYLWRNWPYLATLEARGLSNYSGKIGTCEANHRRYTYRMKRQGRYWGKVGAEAMVRVIDSLRNNELDDWLNQAQQPVVDQEKQAELWRKAQRFARKKAPFEPHKGVLNGRLGNRGPSSTPFGRLNKGLNQL